MRIDEFASVPDNFIDVKDRIRFTSVGFDRTAKSTSVGGGVVFQVRREALASRDLPQLEYARPHIPVHQLVQHLDDSLRSTVKGLNYGESWQGQQFVLSKTLTLTASDWLTVCQVAVTVVASVSISAEVSWQAVAGTNVNWRFLRDNKVLHVSAGHHLANALKTVTPISELYFNNEPAGTHSYVLQLQTETADVSVTPPTRLLVIS